MAAMTGWSAGPGASEALPTTACTMPDDGAEGAAGVRGPDLRRLRSAVGRSERPPVLRPDGGLAGWRGGQLGWKAPARLRAGLGADPVYLCDRVVDLGHVHLRQRTDSRQADHGHAHCHHRCWHAGWLG